jgi:hypothetical protein
MTYRKFKADYLFMGGGEPGAALMGEDMVLITTEDGTVQGVVESGFYQLSLSS